MDSWDVSLVTDMTGGHPSGCAMVFQDPRLVDPDPKKGLYAKYPELIKKLKIRSCKFFSLFLFFS